MSRALDSGIHCACCLEDGHDTLLYSNEAEIATGTSGTRDEVTPDSPHWGRGLAAPRAGWPLPNPFAATYVESLSPPLR